MAGVLDLIWANREAEYSGLDSMWTDLPVSQSGHNMRRTRWEFTTSVINLARGSLQFVQSWKSLTAPNRHAKKLSDCLNRLISRRLAEFEVIT